jgi:hypothetical protein
VPALFVLVGIVRMRRSRLDAYRTFKTAVLIIIFVTQFFAFYHQQLLALFGLAVNILIEWLIGPDAAQVNRARTRHRTRGAQPPPAASASASASASAYRNTGPVEGALHARAVPANAAKP